MIRCRPRRLFSRDLGGGRPIIYTPDMDRDPVSARPAAILQVIPRLDVGGAERVVLEITEGLARQDFRVLVASAGGVLAAQVEAAGGRNVSLPLATKNPAGLLRNAVALGRLIRAEGIALVHAHSRAPAWSARLAARRAGVAFVTTYHGAYGERSAAKRLYNSVMASGDRVIAVSDFVAGLVRARYGTPPDRLRVIHGGVDPGRFDPAGVAPERRAALAAAWRLPPGAPVILLPGRLTAWKGQRVMIAALPLLTRLDAVAVLAGSDQGRAGYAADLARQTEALGVAQRVRFAGHCEDMAAAYCLADIVVNASTDPEAFGRTIVEAQAMGRIVIAADHGGARETILRDETGLLVPPGDPPALAEAIDRVLGLPEAARGAFGARAREAIIARFSLSGMQARVIGVYRELQGTLP